MSKKANPQHLETSDYTPEQVEALASRATKEFIERMGEIYVFLSERITGYEVALRLIEKEVKRLKEQPRENWVEVMMQCPVPMDDLPPRSKEYPRKLRL
jgi:hypothetical protein